MKFSKWLNDNAFEIVYLAISIATFTHTAWASATVLEGPIPESLEALTLWWFKGSLLAITVDIGMLITARKLSKHFSIVLGGAFLVLALASFYTQVLFAVHHTGVWTTGAGVSGYWSETLTPLIDARIILVPLMLPMFAIIFTIARMKETYSEIGISLDKHHNDNSLFLAKARELNPIIRVVEPRQLTGGVYKSNDDLWYFDFSINGSKERKFGPYDSQILAEEDFILWCEKRERINNRTQKKISS